MSDRRARRRPPQNRGGQATEDENRKLSERVKFRCQAARPHVAITLKNQISSQFFAVMRRPVHRPECLALSHRLISKLKPSPSGNYIRENTTPLESLTFSPMENENIPTKKKPGRPKGSKTKRILVRDAWHRFDRSLTLIGWHCFDSGTD